MKVADGPLRGGIGGIGTEGRARALRVGTGTEGRFRARPCGLATAWVWSGVETNFASKTS